MEFGCMLHFLIDFVLDIKKNVVHNNINCEECTKK